VRVWGTLTAGSISVFWCDLLRGDLGFFPVRRPYRHSRRKALIPCLNPLAVHCLVLYHVTAVGRGRNDRLRTRKDFYLHTPRCDMCIGVLVGWVLLCWATCVISVSIAVGFRRVYGGAKPRDTTTAMTSTRIRLCSNWTTVAEMAPRCQQTGARWGRFALVELQKLTFVCSVLPAYYELFVRHLNYSHLRTRFLTLKF